MLVDYSIELIFIETYAPQFSGHNKIFLGSVGGLLTTFFLLMVNLQFEISSFTEKNEPYGYVSLSQK